LNDKIPLDLAFDLVRSTEAAALSAGRWMGLGKPEEADRVATKRMLASLNLSLIHISEPTRPY